MRVLRKSKAPVRTGCSYTEQENEDVLEQLEAGKSAADIAAFHQRTTKSVEHRIAFLYAEMSKRLTST